MVSGPVLLKIKAKVGFPYVGGQKNKKTEANYEIGQIVVSGALDRTKKIRKTAADIFAKSGPEELRKNK